MGENQRRSSNMLIVDSRTKYVHSDADKIDKKSVLSLKNRE